MAAESEESTYYLDRLMSEALGPEADAADAAPAGGGYATGRLGFFPILVGLMGAPPAAEDGDASPPPDRIVLVNPLTQGMVVLQGDPDLVAGLLSEQGRLGGGGPPPASKASIAAMRTVDPGDLKPDEECPVCLEELTGGEEESVLVAAATVKEMPCWHRFHGGCIEKWLGMHGSCPCCRFQMPAEEAGENKKGARAQAEAEGEEGEGEDGEMRRQRRENGGVWVTFVYGRRRPNGRQAEGDEGAEDGEVDGGN